jgi:arginyl-tRNA synthetase
VTEWVREPLGDYLAGVGQDMAVPALERPARPEHGDLALNLALRLARPLGRKPDDIALELAKAIPIGGPVASVEPVRGFVNIRLDPAWLFRNLAGVSEAADAWGSSQVGAGQTVQVEFVSTNPTGPLLVSHGRGAVVGDAIARLLAFSGHVVQREFYVNDRGTQVELFGKSLQAARRSVPLPEGGYAGEYITELAARLPADLDRSDDSRLVGDWATSHFLDEYKADLAALGVAYDNWFSERSLYDGWDKETMSFLREQGVISEHDGATWVTLPDGTEAVLIKSAEKGGDPTYLCSDLFYHRDKFIRRGFDRVIDVWGPDHQNEVRRMVHLVEMLGVDPARFTVVVHQWVRMKKGAEFIKLSKRAGNVVLLRDLVNEIGADATRYHYLLRAADAPMDFDIDLARRQSNENPVFYAQYAHARLCSVRAVAAESNLQADAAGLERLGAPGEIELAREIFEFPEVVADATQRLEPHQLPHYAQRLAERIHGFYHAGNNDGSLRVIVEDKELSRARLMLCEAARITMSTALGLMGVAAPERM